MFDNLFKRISYKLYYINYYIVYFVNIKSTNIIKIGVTSESRLKDRLVSLGIFNNAHILLLIITKNIYLEGQLHKKFINSKANPDYIDKILCGKNNPYEDYGYPIRSGRTEYFYITKEILEYIEDSKKSNNGDIIINQTNKELNFNDVSAINQLNGVKI